MRFELGFDTNTKKRKVKAQFENHPIRKYDDFLSECYLFRVTQSGMDISRNSTTITYNNDSIEICGGSAAITTCPIPTGDSIVVSPLFAGRYIVDVARKCHEIQCALNIDLFNFVFQANVNGDGDNTHSTIDVSDRRFLSTSEEHY